MSTISNIQQVPNRYNFSMEKPTQSMDEKVLIKQSDSGLKISVKDCEGKIYPVEKYMIQGLPKLGLIPQQFFKSCFLKVTENNFCEKKIAFYPKGLGGMHGTSLAFGGIPFASFSLAPNGDSFTATLSGTTFTITPGQSRTVAGRTFALSADRRLTADGTLLASVANGNMTIHANIG